MNKKTIATLIAIAIIIFSLIFLLNLKKDNYTFSVSSVDEFSPDINITVYKNDKKIKVKKIMFIDNTEVIASYNDNVITINRYELEKKFKFELENGKIIIAKRK